ncbi:MAG TPA: V-type ATPase subunit [Candidatus Pullilachnospira intestinigallinarum]|nr:V-type ATPase subunit [Candidatus Pullilachnospira intestinigallinarum]
MSKHPYVYASARIRVLENRLLTEEDFQALQRDSMKQCLQLLGGRGWETGREEKDTEEIFEREIRKIRQIFSSLDGVREDLRILWIPHRLRMLKAAVKAPFGGNMVPEEMRECCRKGEALLAAAEEASLSEKMKGAVRLAKEVLEKQGDGQLCELLLDRVALEEMLWEGERSGIRAVREYAGMTAENADISILLRGIRAGWGQERFRQALVEINRLKPSCLARKASEGEETIKHWLKGAGYGEAAKLFDSPSAASKLERWQQGRLRQLIGRIRQDIFSGGIILAYFLSREQEIRRVRMILEEKKYGGGERMR